MIKFLRSLFRPKKLYIVYNHEEHVGSFFQAAFYERDDANLYIAKANAQNIEHQIAREQVMQDWARSGGERNTAPRTGPFSSELSLNIEEYNMSLTGWLNRNM